MADAIHVLYVDDDPGLLELGKRSLPEFGNFIITTLESAPDALDLLQEKEFDAIVSDYQMPGMDGIRFLIEVRARFGLVPFILFTGRGREEVVIQALNEGADFYLQKGGAPQVQFTELSNKIRYAVMRRRAEEKVEYSLAEKEVLLREIHHRVKNNLAGIISLIGLQIAIITDPAAISVLKDLESRIRSMALVHESLMLSEDLAWIRAATFTENLVNQLSQAYGATSNIYRIEMGDIIMPIETAIPFGMILSEIVTNSLKYAFPETFSCKEIRGEPCTIAISLKSDDHDFLFNIGDNGIGILDGAVHRSHSLGLYLVRLLVEQQLQGSLLVSTTGGTKYIIRFPAPTSLGRDLNE